MSSFPTDRDFQPDKQNLPLVFVVCPKRKSAFLAQKNKEKLYKEKLYSKESFLNPDDLDSKEVDQEKIKKVRSILFNMEGSALFQRRLKKMKDKANDETVQHISTETHNVEK